MMIERVLLAVGILLLAFGLEGCGESERASKSGSGTASAAAAPTPAVAAAPSVMAATSGDPLSIRLTPELSALVKIAVPEMTDVSEAQRIAGRLDVNGYKTARIGAPVTGRIADIRAILGQEVRQGETLAEISSQELSAAQLTFLKAHSGLQLATRSVERAELLLAADVIGSAELQRRQSEMAVARAEKRAAADQLRVLGLPARATDQLERTGALVSAVPITSTLSGTVIERKVAQGQVVNPADALFVVSELRSIWATADIPEQEAARVRRGQRAGIEIPALGNERRTGKIVYVADVVNPETRTVRIGVDLENPDKSLKPAMLINMLIEGSAMRRPVVPAAAVVRESDQDHLFVETAPGVVKLTRVLLGPDDGGRRAILDQPVQTQRKQIRWHVLVAVLQIHERVLAVPHQITHDEQRPFVSK